MTDLTSLKSEFENELQACRDLYVDAGRLCGDQHSELLDCGATEFMQLMNDLHHGLLIKVYVTVSQADLRWTDAEKRLAQVLVRHIWRKRLEGTALREVAQRMFEDARELSWYSVIKPFATLSPLRDRVGELQAVTIRVANLIAKSDGQVTPGEEAALREIQQTLDHLLLGKSPLDSPPDGRSTSVAQAIRQREDSESPPPWRGGELTLKPEPATHPSGDHKISLEEALAELDELIGLDQVKREIHSLTNFLQIQQHRRAHGLPTNELSLHMVFCGNPGTGKTTVARILGRIFGAMGILAKGHLVETDRSGLVAEFAGQTGPKTNRRIDEALDGVLFIDEAYSLHSGGPEDSYGREAIQTLLKRMEDDRHKLIVILAGYPEPMEELLASNPGLQSRFNTHLLFEDYTPKALGQILERMCTAAHYELPAETRWRALRGFQWLYAQRNEHFGNGRLVRNVFERAIRRMANRIAGQVPLTRELLTVLQSSDIELPDVPDDFWSAPADDARLRLDCPECRRRCSLRPAHLGQRVTCPGCQHSFTAAWAEEEAD